MIINKNGTKKTKLKQIESPNQNETTTNCFGYYIKDYLKDFYQKGDSDQESIFENSNKKKKLSKYSSSESDTDYSDDDNEIKNYKKKVIKKCDKLKKKSKKKMQKFINYSRDLFNNSDSDINDDENTKKRNSSNSKKYLDEECQQYKSNLSSCSVYIWRSILLVGFILLITGIFLSLSFFIMERQVVIGNQEEMEIIDREAVKYNRILNQVRALSLILISVGSLLISTLLLPTLVGVSLNCFNCFSKPKDQTIASFFNDYKDETDEENCSKSYFKSNKKNKNGARSKKLKNLKEPIKDNISKIPILEEIKSVQPEREQNECFINLNSNQ